MFLDGQKCLVVEMGQLFRWEQMGIASREALFRTFIKRECQVDILRHLLQNEVCQSLSMLFGEGAFVIRVVFEEVVEHVKHFVEPVYLIVGERMLRVASLTEEAPQFVIGGALLEANANVVHEVGEQLFVVNREV